MKLLADQYSDFLFVECICQKYVINVLLTQTSLDIAHTMIFIASSFVVSSLVVLPAESVGFNLICVDPIRFVLFRLPIGYGSDSMLCQKGIKHHLHHWHEDSNPTIPVSKSAMLAPSGVPTD
jgi:hypothetical protein